MSHALLGSEWLTPRLKSHLPTTSFRGHRTAILLGGLRTPQTSSKLGQRVAGAAHS